MSELREEAQGGHKQRSSVRTLFESSSPLLTPQLPLPPRMTFSMDF